MNQLEYSSISTSTHSPCIDLSTISHQLLSQDYLSQEYQQDSLSMLAVSMHMRPLSTSVHKLYIILIIDSVCSSMLGIYSLHNLFMSYICQIELYKSSL